MIEITSHRVGQTSGPTVNREWFRKGGTNRVPRGFPKEPSKELAPTVRPSATLKLIARPPVKLTYATLSAINARKRAIIRETVALSPSKKRSNKRCFPKLHYHRRPTPRSAIRPCFTPGPVLGHSNDSMHWDQYC